MAVNLLGKKITYTTDLSGAACGCIAAFYLASMRQNGDPSTCQDYYCDAAKICGVGCTEIDIQEGNTHAWFTTLHLGDDVDGSVIGYGGDMGKPDYRDWSKAEYGPGARCIDTLAPFQVSASFHTEGGSQLTALELLLSQGGKPCTISKRLDK